MIEVADTGIGIAEENLMIIFEEFRQVTEGLDPGIKGSGLGLSLCKKYTELLGGTIHVSSKLNVGSVFTIWLPKSKTK
jgi:two-component system chemotaxis sensor kinase CheA